MNNKPKNEKIKIIFLVPYAHCDYAWSHTRRWHQKRYIQIFDEVLAIMEKDKDYKWYFDTENEQLSSFMRKYPQRIDELSKRVLEGKIEIAGGTISNPKIDTLGGETFIRNMVYGRSYFNHLFSIQPQVYTAIDLMPGYSQVPQLLKKGGYEYFRFTRPFKNNLIEFYWQGLDRTKILCSRGPYGYGILADTRLFPHNFKKDWINASKAIYREIKHGFSLIYKSGKSIRTEKIDTGSLGRTGVVWLPRGGDDCRPLRDISGHFLDILGLVKEWRRKENIPLKFATPTDYFRELERHRNKIPVVLGVLDSASTACRYGILGNDSLVIWWLKNEDALAKAERFSTLSSVVLGDPYPEEKLDKLWHDLLSTTGHAIRFVFTNDYDYLLTKVKKINQKANSLSNIACGSIARKIRCGKQGVPIVVFNPLAWDRRDMVKVEVGVEKGEAESIVLKDSRDKRISYQILDQDLYPDKTLRRILFVFIAEVPSLGYSTYYLEKQEFLNLIEKARKLKEIEKQEKLGNKYYDIVIDRGSLISIFLKEKEIELLDAGEVAANSLALCILGSSNSFDTTGPFIEELEEKEVKLLSITSGPVYSKVMTQGWINEHKIRKEIVIYQQLSRIDFRTEIHSKGGDGVFKVKFPLGFDGKLMAHIPFGIEEREFSKEPCRINFASENYPHTFYAGRWIDYSSPDYGIALISSPGRRGYDFDPNEKTIKHVLLKTRTIPRRGCWRHLSKLHEGKGIYSFNYSIYPHKGDWKKAEVHRRALEYQNPLINRVFSEITQRKTKGIVLPDKMSFVKIEPSNIVMTGFYKKSKQVIVRVYESQGRKEKAELVFPFIIGKVKETDFNGQHLKSHRRFNITNQALNFEIEPWEIVTFYLTPSGVSESFCTHIFCTTNGRRGIAKWRQRVI